MIKNLKMLIALLGRRDRIVFCILIAMMIVGALLEILGLGIIPVFVGVLANPQRAMNHPLAMRLLTRYDLLKTDTMVYVGSVGLIAIFIVKNLYLIFNRYLQWRVLKNRQMALMRRLFRSYMYAPYEFHLQRNTAELQRNVIGETLMICQAVLAPLMNLFMNGIMTFSILLLLLFINPWITFGSILVLALAGGVLLSRFQRRVKLLGKQAQQERKEIVKTINQGLGSMKELRLMHREGFFIRDLAGRVRSLATAQTYQEIISQSIPYYMETVVVVTLLFVCILLVALGYPIDAVAPTLSLFAVALVRMKMTVSTLVSGINTLFFHSHCVVPVYEDIKRLENSEDINDAKHHKSLIFREFIELKSITYCYPSGHHDVLRDINLRIEKGTSVAFIGPTGTGKTTLVDIILGLLPPTEGMVLVDGEDIRQNLAGWQRNIGYVPQVIYLTDDTIRRNIALGLDDHEIDNEMVWSAIRSAQLEEFVNSLPQGLDSFVGERGMRISGGQRQRIGIARALYHNPDVLVLDEGTSALDNQTEAAVIKSVEKMKGMRTIIMIAHRLSTTENCDYRYYLENGELLVDSFNK